METNENLFYDKEKLKHSLKWSETKKGQNFNIFYIFF
jgi:hypothetical protein